jgi:perosamine synthetase
VTGYNFRITNIACALLCAQLERCEEILARRNAIFARYDALLHGTPGIGLQPVAEWAQRAPWLYSITVDANAYGRSRDELMALLGENKIETRPFFLALHRLPPFRNESRRRGEELPVTDGLSAAGVNLPTYSALTDADQERIATVIRNGYR